MMVVISLIDSPATVVCSEMFWAVEEISSVVDLDQARSRASGFAPVATQRVALSAANGRVLAADLVAEAEAAREPPPRQSALVTWFVLVIVAAVKAGNGESYEYPFTIRFVS